MALVSPGLQITVTDESQYLPTALGTVPFVLIATSEDKRINGVTAPGTTKANAGKVYGISSQRELATTFGYPRFRQSSAGTPLHGNELNEYGLMAAYSALGLGNRVWVIRADVDLDDLIGTSIRPTGRVANGTVWFDTSTTSFGLFEYNRVDNTFSKITPTLITTSTDCVPGTTIPKSSIGSIGTYAVTVFDNNNYVYYKDSNNAWQQVGSNGWADSYPVVTGTTSTVNLPAGSEFLLNGVIVTLANNITSIADLVTAINSASITGITASAVSGRLAISAALSATNGSRTGVCEVSASTVSTTPVAAGNFVVGRSYRITTAGTTNFTAIGALSNAVGTVFVASGAGTGTGDATPEVEDDLTTIGIANAVYGRAALTHGSFAQVPTWSLFDPVTRPSGSIWIKTSSQGAGVNFTVKTYDSALNVWSTRAMPVYASGFDALFGLDPAAGGSNIRANSSFVKYNTNNNGIASYTIYKLGAAGVTKVIGSTAPSGSAFVVGNSFSIVASVPGSATPISATCTLAGTGPSDFVAAILAANVPNVAAQVEANGAISISHRSGGIITLTNLTGTPVATAGFIAGTTNGVVSNIVPGTVNLTNWRTEVYTFSNNEPYTNPTNGRLWYYNDPTSIDIMVCDSTGWKGYKNLSRDPRGFNLSLTDPNGVIVTPTEPTTQTGSLGAPLVAGDLWLDSGDLENYPRLYRYNSTNRWELVDNTDSTSQNGIVFADARWDNSGTTDPVTGDLPSIRTLLSSDYVDLDAPDYRLYPRGTLLFNTRRSGYTVKRFVQNYFNTQSFNVSVGGLPVQTSTWVSDLGLDEQGVPFFGHFAQRDFVVQAMKAAVDGNLDVREEGYNFNLLTAPGYPELVSNLVSLNNDRANTGFIIADTPMTLASTITDISAYANSLTSSDPYVGLFYPAALSTDLTGNEIAVPASHMMLRTFLHSDNVSYQWFAPAGTRRGLIDNATAIGYLEPDSGLFVRTGVNQQLRDRLYELRINPITLLSGTGIVAYGQKTRAPSVGGGGSSMDRINVARLVNYLRVVLRGVANGFLFEPNDKITRDQVKQLVESVLNDLIAKRGLYDYLVVCDTSNNTPDRIARNELYIDVAIEPMKDVEFIYIPIRLKNPGTISGSASTSTTTQ
jgi:hypothetical protein